MSKTSVLRKTFSQDSITDFYFDRINSIKIGNEVYVCLADFQKYCWGVTGGVGVSVGMQPMIKWVFCNEIGKEVRFLPIKCVFEIVSNKPLGYNSDILDVLRSHNDYYFPKKNVEPLSIKNETVVIPVKQCENIKPENDNLRIKLLSVISLLQALADDDSINISKEEKEKCILRARINTLITNHTKATIGKNQDFKSVISENYRNFYHEFAVVYGVDLSILHYKIGDNDLNLMDIAERFNFLPLLCSLAEEKFTSGKLSPSVIKWLKKNNSK